MRFKEFDYAVYKSKKISIIPIGIKGKDRWYEIWGFVDSGASYSLFSARDAEDLGLNIFSGKRIKIMVGDGSFIPAYLHKIPMRIEDEEFGVTIAFSEKFKVDFNILGRKDIFERFRVCFNDRSNKVSFFKL